MSTTLERRALQIAFMARDEKNLAKERKTPTVDDLTNPAFSRLAYGRGLTPREFYAYLGGDLDLLPEPELYRKAFEQADRMLESRKEEHRIRAGKPKRRVC